MPLEVTHHSSPLKLAIILTLITMTSGCGLGISTGGSSSSVNNAPIPSGTLLVQGTLQPLSGLSGVTGSAAIYGSSGSYTLHFAGLNIPSQTGGMTITVFYNSGGSSHTTSMPLNFTTGNQNYSVSAPVGAIFTQVYISSTTIPGVQYAYAPLY